MIQKLTAHQKLFIKPIFDLAESLNFSAQNKYRICSARGSEIAFATEHQKGVWGSTLKKILGSWRAFDIHFYEPSREAFMIASHPFRWYFQKMIVRDMQGKVLGSIQRRFSFFTKRFEVVDDNGRVLMEVETSVWHRWAFPFQNGGSECARVSKKWDSLGHRVSNQDNFLVEYLDESLNVQDRALVLAASLYIDLMFFGRKASDDDFDFDHT